MRDPAPLKIYLKARQIGFSFAETLAEVLECLERPNTTWLLLSRGERQALELARKAKEHCRAVGAVARLRENESVGEGSALPRAACLRRQARGRPYLASSVALHRLEFPNGSMMIALPANPDTARGYAANVLLDEFAFHRDARAIYAAVYPSITRGLKLRIGSTPFGESGMFYELWTTAGGGFSKHRTDIYEACALGLEADLARLRAGCPDEEIWQQEYACEFVSDATSWIPWELIVAAVQADERCGYLPTAAAIAREAATELFLGADIARHRDLSVLYLVERVGDVLVTRAIERLANATFAEQQAAIERWLASLARAPVAPSAVEGPRIRRCAIDSTGIGAMLAETLQRKFGSRVEPVHFTLAVKEELALRVKRLFEERRIRIPEERELRSAIHAVRKYSTAAGHFRFDADRTERGHADEFWALALAAYAAEAGPVSAGAGMDPEPARRVPSHEWFGVPGGRRHPARREEGAARQGFFGPRGLLGIERLDRMEQSE